MTVGQTLHIGPFTFSVFRLVIAAGIFRILLRSERPHGPFHVLDLTMLLWAASALCSSIFHSNTIAALVSRLGLAYDALGTYLLVRAFVQTSNDFRIVAKTTILILFPLACAMLVEKRTGTNVFSAFGYVHDLSTVRDGKIRAQGAFAHSIIAGTAGAVCLPFVILFWKHQKTLFWVGLFSVVAIIFASTSSGPILTFLICILALTAFRVRHHLRAIRWAVVSFAVLLQILMNRPFYYIISHINLTGSSTGWHRARLIDAAIRYLDEWWIGGTEYTRHWMPTGVPWNENHTDITNHYIKLGVIGGVPLLLIFLWMLYVAFSLLGRMLRHYETHSPETHLLIWVLGSVLTAHMATLISVSYFDQSIVLLYLIMGAIASSYSELLSNNRSAPEIEAFPDRHCR